MNEVPFDDGLRKLSRSTPTPSSEMMTARPCAVTGFQAMTPSGFCLRRGPVGRLDAVVDRVSKQVAERASTSQECPVHLRQLAHDFQLHLFAERARPVGTMREALNPVG